MHTNTATSVDVIGSVTRRCFARESRCWGQSRASPSVLGSESRFAVNASQLFRSFQFSRGEAPDFHHSRGWSEVDTDTGQGHAFVN
jgi:hypothetical protein